MRIMAGTTTVTTAGTRVQLSNTADPVKQLIVRVPSANVGSIYFGTVTVSSTVGLTLYKGDELSFNLRNGSVLFSVLYADAATSGDKLEWLAIVE